MQTAVTSERMGVLVLTIAPEGIYYRERGRRKRFLLPHGYGFQQAVQLHVRSERAEKKARRKR
jgi:hypothetical protein